MPVAQHEFDALTSFDFNTGGIDRATLVRHLSSGDRAKAATAFMNWSKPPVNGRLGTEAPSVKREWRAAALVARTEYPLRADSGPKTQNELRVPLENLRVTDPQGCGDSVLALLPVPSRVVLTFREFPWAAKRGAGQCRKIARTAW